MNNRVDGLIKMTTMIHENLRQPHLDFKSSDLNSLKRSHSRKRRRIYMNSKYGAAEALGLRPYRVQSWIKSQVRHIFFAVWCPDILVEELKEKGWSVCESQVPDWPNSMNRHIEHLKRYITTSPFEEKEDEAFQWPSTEAKIGKGKGLSKAIDQEKGLLSDMGYRVGNNGVAKSRRWEILDDVYLKELRLHLDKSYLAEWGRPKSSQRLKKLAETIAALTRNAKRKNSNYAAAIHEWEKDLAYLKEKFYDGVYDFPWPEV